MLDRVEDFSKINAQYIDDYTHDVSDPKDAVQWCAETVDIVAYSPVLKY